MSVFWADLSQMLYEAIIEEDRWKLYLKGLQYTLMIAAVACIIGIIIGLLVATIKVYAAGSKNPVLIVLNGICNLYTTVIRGTPLAIQLLILWLVVIPAGLPASFVGFGLNSGAYASEIFRSGINSVDKGQMEAGRSLGLSKNTTMRLIVMPQAIKNVVPALFNEFIVLVKETSIAGYIAVNELTQMSNVIRNRTFNTAPLFIAAFFYLVLTIGLTAIEKQIEKRYARSDRS